MDKLLGVAVIIAFIVLASECEFTLTSIIVKAIALAFLVGAAVLSERLAMVKPVPRRRMK